MTLPGFSAEHSLAKSAHYANVLASISGGGGSIRPAFLDSLLVGARCRPQFEWVYVPCTIGGMPAYCLKLEYLGVVCSWSGKKAAWTG